MQYSGSVNAGKVLCNIPLTTHGWYSVAQANPGFVCGKVYDDFMTVQIGGKNGVRTRSYVMLVPVLRCVGQKTSRTSMRKTIRLPWSHVGMSLPKEPWP